jgi:chemotaxis protein MotB
MSLEERNRMLEKYKGDIVVLSDRLSDVNETVKEKDKKLLALLNALDEKETKYDALIADMQKQKAKIKSLTGIKLKVVAALKEALGDKIAIDKKSGSLRLSSNILFDKGSAVLKDEAKVQLKKAFEEYIGTLVTNPKIKPHLDKIIIEGHTDSDGGYLYNLDLSQRRAFAVMNYLLTLDFAKKYNIQPLMIASGRAYLDAIKVNGVEDKDASRRIEIKFRLKNEDAMHEIEKVLDAK